MSVQICTSCHKEFIIIGKENFSKCERCCKKSKEHTKAEIKRIHKDVPKSSLDKTVCEIKDYNKKHGTRYSYGKYIALKERGLL